MPEFGQHLTPLFRGAPLNGPRVSYANHPSPLAIRAMREFHVREPPTERILRIESMDGRHYFVEEAIARQLKFIIDSFNERDFQQCNTLVLDFICGDVLAYVLYFCMIKCHVEIGAATVAEAERAVFGFAERFYLLRDVRMLHLLLEAATTLRVDLMRDLLCEVIVKMIYERTPEDVTQTFDVDTTYIDPTTRT